MASKKLNTKDQVIHENLIDRIRRYKKEATERINNSIAESVEERPNLEKATENFEASSELAGTSRDSTETIAENSRLENTSVKGIDITGNLSEYRRGESRYLETEEYDSEASITTENETERIKTELRSKIVKTNIMADFDYNRAQKLPGLLIEKDDERDENIRDFLNNVKFYNDAPKIAEKLLLIKFLLNCKIQGKSLTELGTATIETFE